MKCLQIIAACVSLLLQFSSSKAQNYALNNGFSNNQTVATCSGIFWDSNINGNYAANQNYIVTFCPGIANNAMQFSFTQMNIASGDTLFVYDGNSSNANLLSSFVNVSSSLSSIIVASDTNSTGCLTFKFVSDAVTQAAGWRADIKCGYACKQKIQGTIGTTPSKDINGFTNICLNANGKVEFDLTTAYPNNDLIYHQADTSTYFHWFFGDGKDTLKKNLTRVTHTYTQEGGYNIKVVMIDSNGCLNTVPIVSSVRTGIKPIFRINAPTTICLKDTVKLTPLISSTPTTGGIVTTLNGSFFTLPVSGDSLFLPDQQNNLGYKSNILIDQFLPGQTLTNINDLKGIFMNMEHSYLGDLDITITAPNGVTVSLKNYPGGSLAFLGEPVKEPTPTNSPLVNVAGKGYEYQFNSTPRFGTMAQESILHSYSYIDNAGQTVNNHRYLPAGSYASASSLSALVGTPLNGTWTLKIQDHLAIDNGFLFNWRLDFNPSIYPNVQVFNVPVVSQNWVTPSPSIVQLNGTIATIVPQTAGFHNFIYRVQDGYGCIFDTTVKIEAKAQPTKPNLGPDAVFCSGQTSLILSVTNPDGAAFYTWDNGGNGVAITVTNPNTYIVSANNAFGCLSKDTIVVGVSNNVAVSLGNDTFYCASSPNVLKPKVSSNISSYLWNDGSTADTLKISAPGAYWVKASTASGCNATANLTVNDNPVNSYAMPLDTIICEKSSYQVTLVPPVNTSVLWNDGVVGNSHLITGPNTYSTIANNIGCLKADSLIVTTKPLPVVDLGLDTTLCTNKTYLLKASYPTASFNWNDNSTDTFLLAKLPGIYWVEGLFNQCIYRDSIEISYKKCECETIMPNAFSPNGDGINELFAPMMQCVPVNYQLSIFNRYGQAVFESRDYLKGWDGKRNGQPLPIGTYYYIIT